MEAVAKKPDDLDLYGVGGDLDLGGAVRFLVRGMFSCVGVTFLGVLVFMDMDADNDIPHWTYYQAR